MLSVFGRRSSLASRFATTTANRLGADHTKSHAPFLMQRTGSVTLFSTKPLVSPPTNRLSAWLPSGVLLMGGALAVGSHLSAREASREFLPQELCGFDDETLALLETEDFKHHKYLREDRLFAVPFVYMLFSSLSALVYKLERPSRRGKVHWLPRFGSPMAASCITGATLAGYLALEHLFMDKEREEASKKLLGCVLHDYEYQYKVDWFQKIGQSVEMTPRQRELFLREKWHFLGNETLGLNFIGNLLFLHVGFRNLVLPTNPAASVCLYGLAFFGFVYGMDNLSTSCGACSSKEEDDVVYVPVMEGLEAMVGAMGYFATGRFAVPVAALFISSLIEVVKRKPDTLPFAISMRGTSSGCCEED